MPLSVDRSDSNGAEETLSRAAYCCSLWQLPLSAVSRSTPANLIDFCCARAHAFDTADSRFSSHDPQIVSLLMAPRKRSREQLAAAACGISSSCSPPCRDRTYACNLIDESESERSSSRAVKDRSENKGAALSSEYGTTVIDFHEPASGHRIARVRHRVSVTASQGQAQGADWVYLLFSYPAT